MLMWRPKQNLYPNKLARPPSLLTKAPFVVYTLYIMHTKMVRNDYQLALGLELVQVGFKVAISPPEDCTNVGLRSLLGYPHH